MKQRTKPQVLLMENVPEVIGQKNMIGVLMNGKDFLPPKKRVIKTYLARFKGNQFWNTTNRNRTFMV